jgi:curli production assembly/transport component CsgF
MRRTIVVIAVALTCAATAPAIARDLVYSPVNPTFGGPTANGPTLMSEAQAQNRFTSSGQGGMSSMASATPTATPSELFASQLQSQLLSSLANQVNNAIFGANAQPSGKFTYGTQTISFNRTLSNINVTIADSSTGQTTQVQVPLVQVTQ